ncbi:hypothetical protein C8R45DRAFT_831440 [Mycena sanguinolenta]|nr:hypothetical protein C8R45DRAFT_831440 [Mycena sanguinolenta]
MDDDPRVVWQSLEEVHRSQGLSTQLALKRRMLSAVKDWAEPMLAWVSRIRGMATTLRLLGAPVSDLDTILALTGGLGAVYKTLILQLDGVPDSQLTLKYVVQRLINYDTIDHEGDITTGAALAALQAAGGGNGGGGWNGNGGGGNGGNGGAGGGANGGAGDGGGRTCYKCGRSGHIRKFCPDGQGGGSHAGATSGSGAGGTGNGTGVAGYAFAF